MTDSHDALQDRRERSDEVRETYRIQYAGLQAWVVQHPEEPKRIYFVDMAARRCGCPNWHCTAQGLGIDCKHILALDPTWRTMTGRKIAAFVCNGRPTDDAGFVAVVDPDPDDPFKD